MLYVIFRPFADQFILFNLFRYITFRCGRRLPDGAGGQLRARARR